MTQPLLGQRTRGELIAELYDRHAAGLFAYCHDQLGDPGSAAAALVAVLNAVPDVEPPRAALYALARREIRLRDVVYAPPAAGTDTDPIAAFVERVLRDLRPHQREVLLLSGVCEMDTAELSWVLDVAADTADELTVSACHRFAQSLNLALASARVPEQLADAFGALAVAPVRDVLGRFPWASPPAALRALALGSPSGTAAAPPPPAPPAALPVKPLWPTTPAWPLPLAEADALTGTGLFPPPDRFPDPLSPAGLSGPFSAPDPDAVSAHEATTEPMPKLKDTVLTALDDLASPPRRPRLQRPRPRGASARPKPPAPAPSSSPASPALSSPPASPAPAASPLPAPLPADVLDDVLGDVPAPLNDLFRPLTPEARAALAYTDKLVASAPREEPIPAAFHDWPEPVRPPEPPAASPVSDVIAPARPSLPGWPLRAEELDAQARHDQAPSPQRPGTGQAPSPERPGTGQAPSPQWPDIDRAPYSRRPKHAAPRHAARSDALPPTGPAAEPVTESATVTESITAAKPLTESVTESVTTAESRTVTRSLTESPTESPIVAEPAFATEPEPGTPDGAGTVETDAETTKAARPRRPRGRARRKHRPTRQHPRHHDWMWELAGFLICVTIAMIVFFAMPTP